MARANVLPPVSSALFASNLTLETFKTRIHPLVDAFCIITLSALRCDNNQPQNTTLTQGIEMSRFIRARGGQINVIYPLVSIILWWIATTPLSAIAHEAWIQSIQLLNLGAQNLSLNSIKATNEISNQLLKSNIYSFEKLVKQREKQIDSILFLARFIQSSGFIL